MKAGIEGVRGERAGKSGARYLIDNVMDIATIFFFLPASFLDFV
jgi:hypothetical protein